MLRSTLPAALRTLRRRPGATALHVVGLAVGLAACLLIGRYVADGWRADRFHAQADRIVRVSSHLNVEGDPMHLSTAQGPLAPALEAEVPGVARAVRLIGGGYALRRGAEQHAVHSLFYADPAFFDVFSFEMRAGDPATALAAPHAIVLTETLARRFFGAAPPARVVGQTLALDDAPPLTVTAVVADVPPTSSLAFEALVSMATRQAEETAARGPGGRAERSGDPSLFAHWGRFSFWTYALLEPGTAPETLAEALPGVLARHAADGLQKALTYEVMPLTDVYLHDDALFLNGPRGDAVALRVVLAVAVFILVIAGINFVNLATARAVTRAREVGVRKTLGSTRGQLVRQFLAEAVLTALAALALALCLAHAALPVFRTLAGTELAGGLVPSVGVALALVGVAVAVGLAAGAYPALVLAGYRPARVLRGTFGTSREGRRLRQGLVVVQFAIAIGLVAATGVVRQQMQFVQSRDLGFAAEQLVTLNYGQDEGVNRRREAVKRALEDVPGVVDAAASVYVPGRGQDVTGFEAEGPDGRRRATKAYRYDVDADFFDALGIEVLAGRTFSDDFGTDARWAVVVNAAAARHFGYDDPAEAVGQTLRQHDGQPVPNTIIGVVEDFHFNSLHEAVEPLVILPLSARYAAAGRFLTLRVRADDLPATMDAVQARWAELVPGRPYDAQFLDATFAALYEQDRRFGRLFGVFAGLALFVAGLGLFGLATHTVQQRTKEIGIRKALGASVGSLVALLSGGIARLVGVAFVVAVPVAYLGASRWLEGFAYRIDLGAGVFAGAGLVALAVALATVGTQAWRAARADPTRALRSE